MKGHDMNGLIIDSFAGGGGASTGIEAALGRPVDIAINHDRAAIMMHKINHPRTKHYCEDVWDVNPKEATGGRHVRLMWLSPDCKHFSKAKGSKPVSKKIRGLAWVAVRWAKEVRPEILILENVEEFKTWGPLLNGRPHPEKKGQTFDLFIGRLRKLGYAVEWKELSAADYGAATSRKRFFMIARCDGAPIIWPEATHGAMDSPMVKSGKLKPWRTAAEIMDWSIPCPSIFDRKKPLCENTMRRIARGLEKFVLNDPEPFIVPMSVPFISQSFGGGYTGSGRSVDKPLPTVTAVDHNHLVMPFLSQYHSYDDTPRGQAVKNPLLTLDGSNRYALIAPFMSHYYGASIGRRADEPVGAITSQGQHIAEVRAFLIKYYGQGIGQSVDVPLGTLTGRDRFGLVTIKGQDYQIVDIGLRMLTPRECFNAHNFPADYIIDRGADGKPMSKKEQTAKVGNSVVPALAEALVRANITDAVMTA